MSDKHTMTYKIKIQGELQDLLEKTKTLKSSLEGIASGKDADFSRVFKQIEASLDKLASKTAAPLPVKAFDGLYHEVDVVRGEIEGLAEQITRLQSLSNAQKLELLPKEEQKRIADSRKALENFNKETEAATQSAEEYARAQKELLATQKKVVKLQEEMSKSSSMLESAKQQYEISKKENEILIAKTAALKAYIDAKKKEAKGESVDMEAAKKNAKNAGLSDADLDGKPIEQLAASYKILKMEQEQQEKTAKGLGNALASANKEYLRASNAVDAQKKSVEALTAQLAELEKGTKKSSPEKLQLAYAKLRNETEKLGNSLKGVGTEYSAENLEKLKAILMSCESEGLQRINETLSKSKAQTEAYSVAVNEASKRVHDLGEENRIADEKVQNARAFAERIKQFVGLRGAAMVARKALNNAMSTIKQLDATMTEMSVVTDLTVGDYWEQLPEYSKQASELGVSINDAYKAATLYYQQGLRSNEVTKISAETLKLAKIANLEAEDATNKMTAALRGFNMELNETSAQRVSDVYSELAAITAADVGEISNAMTKTASIAHSAGMQFETTAAFLSQIIETTRESAETAGTAMKTIIARFQELKKAPEEIGEVDGEIVDANKIETALRSVGVSLRDAHGQFRELDDVFLELSGKWGSLDKNTQRYIATIAAGSRQQSRFIAMMSDYGRTQELVTAANNSAGASQKQFEKTLDSLASKMEKLKNAWDTFTMDLLDSDVLKGAIDLLTKLLEGINELTEKLGDLKGLGVDGDISGTLKIGALVGGFALADKAITVFKASINDNKTVMQSFGAIGQSAIQSIQDKLVGITSTFNDVKARAMEAQDVMAWEQSVGWTKKDSTPLKKEVGKDFSTELLKEYNKETQKQLQLQEQIKKAEKTKGKAEKEKTTLKRKDAIGRRDNVIAEQNKLIAESNIAVAESEKQKITLTKQYATENGLTITQSKAALEIQAQGLVQDRVELSNGTALSASTVAQQAALGGLTTQKIADYKASMIAQGLNQDEINDRMAQITLTYAQAGAQVQENGTKKKGIALAFANIGARLKEMTATLAQTIAQKIQNATMATGIAMMAVYGAVVLIVVAAVALLVIGIIALVRAFQDSNKHSPEKRLEAATKSLEAATEAADEAAEKFDTLNNAFESLGDKYASLEELTKGTKEWQEAMGEINNEVADLITQYPELAGLVTSKNGVLTIDLDSEESQDILREYKMQSVMAQSGVLLSKINVLQAEKAVEHEKLIESDEARFIRVGLAKTNLEGHSEEGYLDSISRAVAEGILAQDKDGKWSVKNQEKFNDLNISLDSVQKFGEALGDSVELLKDYGRELKKREQQENSLYQAMVTQSLQGIDLSSYAEQDRNQIVNYGNSSMMKNLVNENLNEFKGEYYNAGDREEYLEKIIKEKTGKTVSVTIEEGGLVFEDTYTITDSAGNESESLRVYDLLQDYSAQEATEEMSEKLEKLPQAIDDFIKNFGTKDQANAFEKMLSVGSGGELTSNDLNALWNSTDMLPMIEQVLENSPQLKEVFGSASSLYNVLWEIGSEARAYQEQILSEEEKLGIHVEDVSLEQQKKYLGKLNTIYMESGDSMAYTFNSQIQTITRNLNAQELEKFYAQLNALDWENTGDWEGFKETLYQLGIYIPKDEMDDFIKSAIRANNALEKFNLDEFTNRVKKVGAIIKNIFDEEQDRSFSLEEYSSLISTAPDLEKDFVENLDGTFTYIGESLIELSEVIRDALLNSRLQGETQLREKIDAARELNNIKVNDSKYDVSNNANWSEDEKREFVLRALEDFTQSEIDISQLGITGLGNETTVETINEMTTKDLEAVIEDLSKIGTDSLIWEKQLNSTIKQTNGLLAQFNTINKNAELAAESRESFSNIESEIIQAILNSNSDYLAYKTALEDAIAEGDQSTIESITAAMQAIENAARETAKTEISKRKENSKNEIIGYMGAIYSQALSKGISEEALSLYSQIISIIQNSSPDLSNFDDMLGTATEFESVLLQMVDAAEAANEALNQFAMEFDYFEALEIAKDDIDFREERLEKQHDRAKKSDVYDAEDLSTYYTSRYEMLVQEAQVLQTEQQSWATIIADAMKDETNPFAKFTALDSSTGSYFIDYNAANDYIKNIEDETQKKQAQDMLSRHAQIFETFSNAYKNNILALEDLVDEAAELFEYGQDEYYSLVDRIAESLVEVNEKALERLEDINSTIENTQSQLIEGIQQQINERRQEKENEKTEKELADKYSKAAYLRAGSSGSAGSDYYALQQDILEAEENYQERLTDQALQAMQQANDEAAKQRNTQIDIARQQLDSYKNSEQLFIDAEFLLLEGMANSEKFSDSRAGLIIQSTENFRASNEKAQSDMLKELDDQGMVAALYGKSHTKVDEFLTKATDEGLTVTSGVFNIDPTNLEGGFDTLSGAFESLGQSIGDQETGLVGSATNASGQLVNVGKGGYEASDSLLKVGEEGQQAYSELSNIANSDAGQNISGIGESAGAAKDHISGLGTAASDAYGKIDGANSKYGDLTGKISDATTEFTKEGGINKTLAGISGTLTDAKGDLQTRFGDINKALGGTTGTGGIVGSFNSIKEALGGTNNTNSVLNQIAGIAFDLSEINIKAGISINDTDVTAAITSATTTSINQGWSGAFDVFKTSIYTSLGYELKNGVWSLTSNLYTEFQKTLADSLGLDENEKLGLITSINSVFNDVLSELKTTIGNTTFSDVVLSYGNSLQSSGSISANLTMPGEWTTYFSLQTTYLSQLVTLVGQLGDQQGLGIEENTKFAIQNLFASNEIDLYYKELLAWSETEEKSLEGFSESTKTLLGQVLSNYNKYLTDFEAYKAAGVLSGDPVELSEFITSLPIVRSLPALQEDSGTINSSVKELTTKLAELKLEEKEMQSVLQALGVEDGMLGLEDITKLSGETVETLGITGKSVDVVKKFLGDIKKFNEDIISKLDEKDKIESFYLKVPIPQKNTGPTGQNTTTVVYPPSPSITQRKCGKDSKNVTNKAKKEVQDIIQKGTYADAEQLKAQYKKDYDGKNILYGEDELPWEEARTRYFDKLKKEFGVTDLDLYLGGYLSIDEYMPSGASPGDNASAVIDFLDSSTRSAKETEEVMSRITEDIRLQIGLRAANDNPKAQYASMIAQISTATITEGMAKTFLQKLKKGEVAQADLDAIAASGRLGDLKTVIDGLGGWYKFWNSGKIDAWNDYYNKYNKTSQNSSASSTASYVGTTSDFSSGVVGASKIMGSTTQQNAANANNEDEDKVSLEDFTALATSTILGSSVLNQLGIAEPLATIVNILLGHLGVIQTISEILSTVFKPVLEGLSKTVKFLFGYEEKNGEKVDGLLTKIFKGIGSGLEWLLAKFGKNDIDIDGDGKTAEDNEINSIGGDIKNGWNAFTDGVEDAWNTTTTFVGNTWNAGTTLVGDAWDAGTTWVVDKATGFAEGAKEIANSVADAATDAYRYSAEVLQNVGDGIIDGFNSLLSRWGRSKDGSVAHYTGPMWIDGTPSYPEMILNPQQTQDMLAVVEYLNSKDGEALNNYPQLRRLGKTIPKLKQYKTGGRVNTTGLAWLDGTRRRPEYVLNSKQTQDFFDLQKFIAERKNKALSRPQNIPKKQENDIFATLRETLATETLVDFFYDKLGNLINAFKPNKFGDQLKNSAALDNVFSFDLSSIGSFFRKSPNQNFSIQDLSSRINTKMESSPVRGDNYFDIDINVENISDDYDIEQIADKIRSMLYEDAAFRNVRALMN